MMDTGTDGNWLATMLWNSVRISVLLANHLHRMIGTLSASGDPYKLQIIEPWPSGEGKKEKKRNQKPRSPDQISALLGSSEA
ncbi:hypothetical protein T02_9702 [Trichinella nativa]|uniref:Uncharacterized protein n=1 Tax=Trichinella nativa TaxID=6335 RepID=A0A0V1LQ06_9BILA|nr:hypothetical protein T02_9702 [Trichinella nativa]